MVEHQTGTGGHYTTHDRNLQCEVCMGESNASSAPIAAERKPTV